MRMTEVKKCKKCGKLYSRGKGGIVVTPKELMDSGICTPCKVKNTLDKAKMIISKKGKE